MATVSDSLPVFAYERACFPSRVCRSLHTRYEPARGAKPDHRGRNDKIRSAMHIDGVLCICEERQREIADEVNRPAYSVGRSLHSVPAAALSGTR